MVPETGFVKEIESTVGVLEALAKVYVAVPVDRAVAVLSPFLASTL